MAMSIDDTGRREPDSGSRSRCQKARSKEAFALTDVLMMTNSKAAESGFYPTPAHLVQKMLDKVDWYYVDTILEPSAGKGDLAIPAAKKALKAHNRWSADASEADLDCVEIDGNLRAILREKGLRVVHDDFLTYTTAKRYSLIIMNPPFEDGARHCLKAISLLAEGGQLVCLLNAETVKNPYSNDRKALVKALGDAEIDFLPGEFLTAERKTGVETAMIVYKKPVAEEDPSLIMESLRAGHKYVEMSDEEANELTKADFIAAIVDRYNYEVECGISLIREWRKMNHILSSSLTDDKSYGTTLQLSCGKEAPSVNEFVKRTRAKYWSALFGSPQFMNQLTTNLLEDLTKQIEKLKNYEFSAFNIFELMIQMNSRVNEGVEKTIMDLFDDWTRKYSWRDENSPNRHYFDGWKTNDAFAVNRKVIIPMYMWDSIFNHFEWWKIIRKMEDIEKVMNYLDGGRTAEGKSIRDAFDEAEKAGQTKKIPTKYFYVTLYKKGTAHIEFRNMDLLAKFNIFAARGKNWLPPAFGKKRYSDLSAEEKKTVDSFMDDTTGRKYDAVCAHANYFLSTGSDALHLTA